MDPVKSFFIGLFLFLISIVSFIEHLIKFIRILTIKKNGIKTQGIVTDLIYDEEEKLAARLIVEYDGNNGKRYFIESSVGSAFNSNKKGKKITVT